MKLCQYISLISAGAAILFLSYLCLYGMCKITGMRDDD